MPSHKTSICLDCQNAYAHKCERVRCLKPIEGWKAEKRKYKDYNGPGFTYSVISCPNFKHDKEKARQTEKTIVYTLQNTNLTAREAAKAFGVSENKIWRLMQKYGIKSKGICKRCGAEFVRKANNKLCEKCKGNKVWEKHGTKKRKNGDIMLV